MPILKITLIRPWIFQFYSFHQRKPNEWSTVSIVSFLILLLLNCFHKFKNNSQETKNTTQNETIYPDNSSICRTKPTIRGNSKFPPKLCTSSRPDRIPLSSNSYVYDRHSRRRMAECCQSKCLLMHCNFINLWTDPIRIQEKKSK